MNTQRGITLIVILIFLQIFTLLGVYTLQNTVLQQRIVNNSWQKNNLLLAANTALNQAKNQLLLQTPNCVIEQNIDFIQPPLSWWKKHACISSNKQFQYYYVVQMLGNNPCALVANTSADYYRLTILANSSASLSVRVILQGVLVKAASLKTTCAATTHIVKPGWQLKTTLG